MVINGSTDLTDNCDQAMACWLPGQRQDACRSAIDAICDLKELPAIEPLQAMLPLFAIHDMQTETSSPAPPMLLPRAEASAPTIEEHAEHTCDRLITGGA